MTKMTPIAYVVLLLAAFLLGLMGTLAASRTVAGMSRHRMPRGEAPASMPLPPRGVSVTVVDC